MAKVVKCHGGGYMMVGRYTKAQEAEIYKMLGDGPKSWFRRERPATPACPVLNGTPREGDMKYREGDWEWETPPEFRVKLKSWAEYKKWYHERLMERDRKAQEEGKEEPSSEKPDGAG
jgi:hypothetical protein